MMTTTVPWPVSSKFSVLLMLLVSLFAWTKDVAAAQSETEKRALLEKGRAHWAFQPLLRPELPRVDNAGWIRNPVDRFILHELETRELSPAPPAGRESFIRRVTFDLIGLPPTPAEIDAFLKDESAGAAAALVERLLASPRYGERWGRHWLDLARFAESDGFEHDAVRPHAWRYRDYVIDSFNADKPYDRFVLEQVAGDALFPEDREARVATAFNLLGPDMVDSSDQVQRRLNRLNDMTDTTGLAFLGLTVGCARCHDHMFEPISQKDYFRLQAFFTPAEFQEDRPIPTEAERSAHERSAREHEKRKAALEQAIERLEAPAREEEKELAAALDPDARARRDRLRRELKSLPPPISLPRTMALGKGDDPDAKTHVLFRGDYNNPGEEVRPGMPEILGPSSTAAGSRADLAAWIAHPDNPLTARVMVNRIWQHHFGRGLVPTPSDFGLNGLPPTHPELLDWLATEFVRQKWSVKAMHRLILLSATYRQSGAADARSRRRDPDNRYYSRWRRLRLEGEVIRDSLLFVSGRLNDAMAGPGVHPPIPREVFAGAKGWKTSAEETEHHRRSIYIFARRNLRFPFLEVFDAPDNNLSCARRGESTTAPQSLTLLNAEEVMEACAATAAAIEAGATGRETRIALAFRRILGRSPQPDELAESMAFLERSPLRELCRALFNLNAFIYVD